jgi:hypothetical protein
MAVSITSVGLVVSVDVKLLQDASITGARNKGINVLPKIFTFQLPLILCKETPNGLRYLLLIIADGSSAWENPFRENTAARRRRCCVSALLISAVSFV